MYVQQSAADFDERPSTLRLHDGYSCKIQKQRLDCEGERNRRL
jgi:hypothetical protein